MSLNNMIREYTENAEKIKNRIAELEAKARHTRSKMEKFRLYGRIATLQKLLREAQLSIGKMKKLSPEDHTTKKAG